ncbi:Dehydrogenase/reductase SDR family member 7 [Sarcoptes scabiei]|nr:Dehydrogenase/reductase SDR family member 7 [Sarcoptes scabiei]
MCEEKSFLLASYALQADYGDYNPKLHRNRYFNPYHYFPSWVIEELGIDYIQRYLPALHYDHKGITKSDAQSLFIKEASDQIAAHNFHLYKIALHKPNSHNSFTSNDIWLAITITGLMIYANDSMLVKNSNNSRCLKTRISYFPWSDIGKLSFDKRKFEIRSTGPQSRKFIYYTRSEELARFLLWFSRANHQFHLMIMPKMREMLKREAEINRRKYRENCISSSSSSCSPTNSNDANTSGAGTMDNRSNTTSDSASPFDFQSVIINEKCNHHHKIKSFLGTSSSSVCYDSDTKSEEPQRVSVISNASSNTTSGIVSEKMHGISEDSDRDDSGSDLLVSLNHRQSDQLRKHAIIHLSRCSSPPVVSMESLAMSEPIDHHRTLHENQHGDEKSIISNKKHSISISNIMITGTSTNFESTSTPIVANYDKTDSSKSSISCSPLQTSSSSSIVKVNVTYHPKPNDIVLKKEKKSMISLRLNINEKDSERSQSKNPNHSRNSDDGDDDDIDDDCDEESDIDDNHSSFDETDSMFGSNRCRHHDSSKSNVTVLSTILKPEAEILLKNGIEADNVRLLNNNIDDGIDSLELAELKSFEQAEKEKLILNSLIDNIPPISNTVLDSTDSEVSDTSSESDSDFSDTETDAHSRYLLRKHYSPLAQEKRIGGGKGLIQSRQSSRSMSRTRSISAISDIKIDDESLCKINKSPSINHIYANVPLSETDPNESNASRRVPMNHKIESSGSVFNPIDSLRPYPSLTSIPLQHNLAQYPHRTGMRIGVSSLSRPASIHKDVRKLLMQGCVHSSNKFNSVHSPATFCSEFTAGSEPNLSNNQCDVKTTNTVADRIADFDTLQQCSSSEENPTNLTEPFRSGTVSAKQISNLSRLRSPSSTISDDVQTECSQFDSIYITPPPSADYKRKTLNGLGSATKSSSQIIPRNRSKSRSMQHLPASDSNGKDRSFLNRLGNGTKTNPSVSVERSCTFRVDEAIAKSALRNYVENVHNENNSMEQQTPNYDTVNSSNDPNNNIMAINYDSRSSFKRAKNEVKKNSMNVNNSNVNQSIRPISWHLDNHFVLFSNGFNRPETNSTRWGIDWPKCIYSNAFNAYDRKQSERNELSLSIENKIGRYNPKTFYSQPKRQIWINSPLSS